MEWYVPITIFPAVGMLIISTTSQMMALSSEIGDLLADKCSPFQYEISDKKIKQLNRLPVSAALLYISAACFILAGIAGALLSDEASDMVPQIIMLIGVMLIFIALFILIIYGIKTIEIRKAQHKENRNKS